MAQQGCWATPPKREFSNCAAGRHWCSPGITSDAVFADAHVQPVLLHDHLLQVLHRFVQLRLQRGGRGKRVSGKAAVHRICHAQARRNVYLGALPLAAVAGAKPPPCILPLRCANPPASFRGQCSVHWHECPGMSRGAAYDRFWLAYHIPQDPQRHRHVGLMGAGRHAYSQACPPTWPWHRRPAHLVHPYDADLHHGVVAHVPVVQRRPDEVVDARPHERRKVWQDGALRGLGAVVGQRRHAVGQHLGGGVRREAAVRVQAGAGWGRQGAMQAGMASCPGAHLATAPRPWAHKGHVGGDVIEAPAHAALKVQAARAGAVPGTRRCHDGRQCQSTPPFTAGVECSWPRPTWWTHSPRPGWARWPRGAPAPAGTT